MKAKLAFMDLLKRIAEQKGATPAQIALAWLLEQKPWIVPIRGTTKVSRLEENIRAVGVQLARQDLHDVEEGASKITPQSAP
jgi:aryl-alcohol dehydrogenase-like predicted oxidoreductase